MLLYLYQTLFTDVFSSSWRERWNQLILLQSNKKRGETPWLIIQLRQMKYMSNSLMGYYIIRFYKTAEIRWKYAVAAICYDKIMNSIASDDKACIQWTRSDFSLVTSIPEIFESIEMWRHFFGLVWSVSKFISQQCFLFRMAAEWNVLMNWKFQRKIGLLYISKMKQQTIN